MFYIIVFIIYIIFLRVGFYLTGTYIDIKAIIITSVITIIVSIITSRFGLIGSVINWILPFYLLCKIGGTDPWPDTALAVIVGNGLYTISSLLLIPKILSAVTY